MDTSSEYIEMCRKATEIQELWKPKKGDWFLPGENMNIRLCIRDGGLLDQLNSLWMKKDSTWLLRQDQLQGMIKKSNKPVIIQLHFFKTWVYGQHEDYIQILSTWEQLWFAFVMHEKYNKKWDGKKWRG